MNAPPIRTAAARKRPLSELRRFAVQTPVEAAHEIAQLEDEIVRLEEEKWALLSAVRYGHPHEIPRGECIVCRCLAEYGAVVAREDD